MKKLVAITGLVLITCVCVGAAAQTETAPSETAAVAVGTTVPQGYIIRDSGGRVAVFKSGGSAPVIVTKTRTDDLPRSDARIIREGIEVQDERQLKRVLEDFCS